MYRQRISGDLSDRIDLHVEVPLIDYRKLSSISGGEGIPASKLKLKGIVGGGSRAMEHVLKFPLEAGELREQFRDDAAAARGRDLYTRWTRAGAGAAGSWLETAAEDPAKYTCIQAYVDVMGGHETLPSSTQRQESLTGWRSNGLIRSRSQ